MITRIVVGMLLAGSAWAAPPHLGLSASAPAVNLVPLMSLNQVPQGQAADPDALWALPEIKPQPAVQQLALEAGIIVVGRVRLTSGRSKDIYVVQVPSSRVDHVQLWFRADGGAWRSAEAGDLVPLARWPFFGQYPAFFVPIDEQEIDLIVSVSNEGRLNVPVWIKTDKAYQEGRLLQSNLSGLVMGMGVMVVVVCLISALTLRRSSSWVLLAYSLWACIAIICINGYASIWVLPDWPRLNDGSKHFSAVMLPALMLWVVAGLADRLRPGPWLRLLGPVAWAASVIYGLLQFAVLPVTWRLAGVLACSGLCIAAAAALCAANRLVGGRYQGLVGAGIASYAVVAALGVANIPATGGLDLWSALAACLLFGSCLLFRHAQFSRERYGRDVMGRAAISANRDPLTALLSYPGFQQCYDEAALREAAGQGARSMMMFLLPGLERSGADHGFVLTERALVRFAAVLQARLGHEWAIGRLSKTRFAAISLREHDAVALIATATQVLSHCARVSDPLRPVSDFDLRIACDHRISAAVPMIDVLRKMEEALRLLEPSKRITLV